MTVPIEYVKRQRMRCVLPASIQVPALPARHRWHAWNDTLVDTFAEVLCRGFADSTDAQLFPSLGSITGCRMLVRAVRESSGFCSMATWLIEGPSGLAGVVLGLVDYGGGNIQNIAVVPESRERGLGRTLMCKALQGFVAAGIRRAELEVTVSNRSALALYRRLGFQSYKTTYRSLERPDQSMVGLGI